MSNLLSRIKKIEEVLGKKNEWRTGDNFLNTLNKAYKYQCNFRKEDLQFFDSELDAFVFGLELALCIDDNKSCETCTDETCTELRKRIKQRRDYELSSES